MYYLVSNKNQINCVSFRTLKIHNWHSKYFKTQVLPLKFVLLQENQIFVRGVINFDLVLAVLLWKCLKDLGGRSWLIKWVSNKALEIYTSALDYYVWLLIIFRKILHCNAVNKVNKARKLDTTILQAVEQTKMEPLSCIFRVNETVGRAQNYWCKFTFILIMPKFVMSVIGYAHKAKAKKYICKTQLDLFGSN